MMSRRCSGSYLLLLLPAGQISPADGQQEDDGRQPHGESSSDNVLPGDWTLTSNTRDNYREGNIFNITNFTSYFNLHHFTFLVIQIVLSCSSSNKNFQPKLSCFFIKDITPQTIVLTNSFSHFRKYHSIIHLKNYLRVLREVSNLEIKIIPDRKFEMYLKRYF